jgi:hypothetical protein
MGVKKHGQGETFKGCVKAFAFRFYNACMSRLHLVRRMRARWSMRNLKWWLQFLLFMEPNPKHSVIEKPETVIAALCLVPTIYVGVSSFLFLYALNLGFYFLPLTLAFFAGTFYLTLLTLHLLYDR